jgi:hypothetical protein
MINVLMTRMAVIYLWNFMLLPECLLLTEISIIKRTDVKEL